jgi:hypothetical protein
MAKRTPPEEQEYRPVSEQLARSVLSHRAHVVHQVETQPREPEPAEPVSSTADEPQTKVREVEPHTTPPLKVVRPRKSRSTRPAETPKEPARAKRKEMTIEKRMVVTASENELFEELVKGIKRELRVTVNGSNVLRASLTLLYHVQEELLKQCRRVDPAPQPPRKDDPTSIQVFEEHLAQLIDSAIRNAKALD